MHGENAKRLVDPGDRREIAQGIVRYFLQKRSVCDSATVHPQRIAVWRSFDDNHSRNGRYTRPIVNDHRLTQAGAKPGRNQPRHEVASAPDCSSDQTDGFDRILSAYRTFNVFLSGAPKSARTLKPINCFACSAAAPKRTPLPFLE